MRPLKRCKNHEKRIAFAKDMNYFIHVKVRMCLVTWVCHQNPTLPNSLARHVEPNRTSRVGLGSKA